MSRVESFEIEMTGLDRKRRVWVYLPDNYSDKGEALPVIYMQDGQNVFSSVSSGENVFHPDMPKEKLCWNADLAMDSIFQRTGHSAIIVGIEHGYKYRMTEYSPWITSRKAKLTDPSSWGGEGVVYGKFFSDTLRKAIDSRYNTIRNKAATAVIGSSMGGYISSYLGTAYPDIYGAVGLFSTAVWFNKAALERHIDQSRQINEQYVLIYAGGDEGIPGMIEARNMTDNSFFLYQKLTEKGACCELIINSEYPHLEWAWAEYFPRFADTFLSRYYDKNH